VTDSPLTFAGPIKLIDNQGRDAVDGVFANFAEGDLVHLGGYEFHFSYHGGDGNDIVVTNVLPTASLSGPSSGVLYQPLAFTLGAADPSPVDQAAGFTYAVNWGDSSSTSVTGLTGITATHDFTAAGTYTVTLTATDKDGGVSQSVSQSVSVFATPQLENGVLAIPGTATAAAFTLTPVLPTGASSYSMKVTRIIGTTSTNLGTFVVPSGLIEVLGGPGTDAVTLNGTSNSDAFTVGHGTVSELASQSTAQATSFTVGLNAVTTTTLDGAGGSDTLTGPNQTNAWAIAGKNAGTLNTSIAFEKIQNLTGGSVADTFTFDNGGSITGNLIGVAPTNTVDDSGYGSPVTVNLQTTKDTGIGGTWANIQSFKGTNTTDALIATDGTTNIWALKGSNAGTVESVTSVGTVNSFAFIGFANLTGGSGTDDFQFANNASVSGVINGGGGSNTLDYSAYTGGVTVNLGNATTGLANNSATGVYGGAANRIANIGNVVVGAGNNYLTAVGASISVTFTATGNGNNILVGGSGNNTLSANGPGDNIVIGGHGTSTINAGTGYNLLIGGYTAYDAVYADLQSIMSIWKTVSSAKTYAKAITNLTAASYAYSLSAATVHGNAGDTISTGTHALDWYFVAAASEITGENAGESVTVC
jgi:acrosin